MPHNTDFCLSIICLFVIPSISLSVYLSFRLPDFLYFCLSADLSVFHFVNNVIDNDKVCNLYNTCQLLWQQWQGMQLTAWLSTHCSNARVPWASAEHQKRKIRRRIFWWKIWCWWFYLDFGEVQIWLQRANKATGNCGSKIDCHYGWVDVLSPLEWFPEYCADIFLGT